MYWHLLRAQKSLGRGTGDLCDLHEVGMDMRPLIMEQTMMAVARSL